MPYLAGSKVFFLIDAPLLFSELLFSISVPCLYYRKDIILPKASKKYLPYMSRRRVAVNIKFAGDPSGR
jgi:hypothetical protein